jgi:hypothetical protein
MSEKQIRFLTRFRHFKCLGALHSELCEMRPWNWGRTVELRSDATARVEVGEGVITLAVDETGETTATGSAFVLLTARQSQELRQALEQAEQKLKEEPK